MDFQGAVAVSRRWWVYRPYHFTLARTPAGIKWHLVDGQFGTIAGWPTDEEVEHLLARRWKALDAERAAAGGIQVLPSRCPECGWDLRLSPKGILQLCKVCGRLLEPSPDGLKVVSYRTLPPDALPWARGAVGSGVAWLPFWVVRGSWKAADREVSDWMETVRLRAPSLSKARGGLPDRLEAFYVPAFPSWTYEGYDEWAFAFAAALTLARIETLQERLVLQRQVGESDGVVLPAVEAASAVSLFPSALPSYLPVPAQIMLTAPILRALGSCPFAPGAMEMAYVPAPLVQQASGPALLGPSGLIPYPPLRDAEWPSVFHRTVRRRLAETAPKASADFRPKPPYPRR
jgi:hypothetical protein